MKCLSYLSVQRRYALFGSIVLIVFLVACAGLDGGSSQTRATTVALLSSTATPLPTVTPMSLEPTSTLTPTETIEADEEDSELEDNTDLEEGRTALQNGDYERALTLLSALYEEDSSNVQVAALLAQTSYNYAQELIAESRGNLTTIQEARDYLSTGLQIAPRETPIYDQLEKDERAVQELVAVLTLLDEIQTRQISSSDIAAQRLQAEEWITSLERAAELHSDFFTSDTLPYNAILIAADNQEAYAEQQPSPEVQQFYLDTAQGLCSVVVDFWSADSTEGIAARACVERIAEVETATPTPEPSPTPEGKRYGAAAGPVYPPSESNNSFDSCIGGQVIRIDGSGVANAQGNVSNGDFVFPWTTNANGEFIICQLGSSPWVITLTAIPDSPGLSAEQTVSTTAWVNGTVDQQVWVEFREQ
ncbi:MAG: tetratricopeptide repeat protein [Chloroflexota bacterium]